ncbi:MAG: glycosyltransferase family 39 protein [Verrucomicrobia bacterium]|nr:glycosyltransferase family 39 protein [Verrucomicrobiota bacterium]
MVKSVQLAFFFVASLLFFSLGNWSLPLIDRDEPRFAEASREMLQSGDFLIPRLNGEFRFDKPPLIYWCQALSFQLFGANDFSARLPSSFFAALTGMATIVWATRLFGDRTGWLAGIVFATSLQVVIHGRAAVADMPMVFFFAVSTWAAWERKCCPGEKRWWWAFYLSVALGFLAKGPVALLPVLLMPLFCSVKRSRYSINPASAIRGTALAIAVIGFWGVPALIVTNGQFFSVGIGKHVIDRSLHPMESHGVAGWLGYLAFLPFYFVSTFLSFFPWSIFLPSVLSRLRRERTAEETYLFLAIAVVFFLFTLLQTKLPHYILPAFPMLSILVAARLSTKMGLTIASSMIIACAGIALFGFPAIAPLFVSKRIAQDALPLISPETRTASVDYDEQSLIWYLRSKVRPFHRRISVNELDNFMQKPGPALCVMNSLLLGKTRIDPAWRSFTVSGRNFARWHLRTHHFFGLALPLPSPEYLNLSAFFKQ